MGEDISAYEVAHIYLNRSSKSYGGNIEAIYKAIFLHIKHIVTKRHHKTINIASIP
jgi:hypothetical protein